jgi:nitrate/TMAO reductase-like tetraheme cytochrome c subunit
MKLLDHRPFSIGLRIVLFCVSSFVGQSARSQSGTLGGVDSTAFRPYYQLRPPPGKLSQVSTPATNRSSEGAKNSEGANESEVASGSLLDSDLRQDSLLEDQPEDMSALSSMGSAGPSTRGTGIPGAGHGTDKPSRDGVPEGQDPHASVFIDGCYPSATQCAKCHQKIYDEWRVSAHAYSAVSPMFHKFEQTITNLSQGTIGTFCMRCHAPVATQAGFEREASILDAPSVFREGVTCIACHRVVEAYGKQTNGERRIEPGDIYAPIYGSIGGDGVAQAIADKDNYKVKTNDNQKGPGQAIHNQAYKFEQLSQSGFCASCHQVDVHPGIALEVVWAQYRAGPACKKGISCQDCHMGLVPGKPLGYSYGAAAEMSGKTVNTQRKHSNHLFYGPGNSIAHPGIFPHNEKAHRWTTDQWFSFDWRAGWGTPEFEKAVVNKQILAAFPKDWDTADERRDARKVLDENFKLLDIKKQSAIAVMEAGGKIDGPFFDAPVQIGSDLSFHYVVSNVSEGHNMPSGSLGAQPQLWLNVVLSGPTGVRLWETGYLDGNGDLANQHSLQVTKGLIPADHQLFNLQTQFLITGVKGTDREVYLPVNLDIDQIPFLRPGAQPIRVLNHPPFIRMESHSIPPLDSRKAKYRIPASLMTQPGQYRLSVRMRSRLEPIYFMRFCDATPEMERRMLEQTIDLHSYSVAFTVY